MKLFQPSRSATFPTPTPALSPATQPFPSTAAGPDTWNSDPRTYLPDSFAIWPVIDIAKAAGCYPPKADTGAGLCLAFQFKHKCDKRCWGSRAGVHRPSSAAEKQ
eukprot:1292467-Ditylum_brightwellii.AAC.1